MKYCRPDRPVDRLHEEELDRIRAMCAQNDIAIAAGMYYCATEEICPPPWLVRGAAKLMIELLKREKSQKRGRAAGRIARYRQDLWDFERWSAVLEIREIRERNDKDLKELAARSAKQKLPKHQKELFQNLEKARKWLHQDTFECASMSLRGSHAYASAMAVKKSYRRVQEAMGTRSAAHRYHLMFGDFVFQIGLEWPGACKPGTKTVPFYDLTP